MRTLVLINEKKVVGVINWAYGHFTPYLISEKLKSFQGPKGRQVTLIQLFNKGKYKDANLSLQWNREVQVDYWLLKTDD